MQAKELEHLETLLEKQPIVVTRSAQELLNSPAEVRERYLRHTRSFVIVGRDTAPNNGEQVTMRDYEKRLIQLVRNKGAAKGYITADYGYGKTSTAAFIWHRCEENNIVAVPPFQIEKLDHFLDATYGWVRFKLEQNYPQLLPEAEKIYFKYINQDIEKRGETEDRRQFLRQLYQEGRYILDLLPRDYVYYFEEMTNLVCEAGFDGLVVIADEVQQYIDPDIKSGTKDPLTPLFDIVQTLMTREGYLPFALLLSVPRKELGLMNDQRSDLIQRLQSDKLGLDLSTIYNQSFAGNLWSQLASTLQFESLKDKIVLPETLEALGQISARRDLAAGPRTVVDVFKLMTRRFKNHQGDVVPFSPLDLVNAFLRGDISYDNTGSLQTVVNEHLAHQFIKDAPDFQKAIKLMAAYPIDGLPERYFDRYGVREAIDYLLRETRGDIVALAGGGYDEAGQYRETRAILIDLQEKKVNADWLADTIREFIRNYYERSQRHMRLAVQGFQELLRQMVFKGDNWKQLRSSEPSLTQNRMILWEGAFPNATKKKFPQRYLQVQIVGEHEALRETPLEGDLLLTFFLQLNADHAEEERRVVPGHIESPQEKTTNFLLNMSYNSGKENYSDLHTVLGPVVAPWKMTPALLLSLYAYLDEKRQGSTTTIPKQEDEMIRANFQPSLLEHAFNQLFNQQLGEELGVAGIRIIEEIVKRQLETYYANYKTLITSVNWQQSLKKYYTAMESLPTVYERQGVQIYEKTKQALAKENFQITVSTLDTFLTSSPLLIKADGANRWRFTLHPLEEEILRLLKESPHAEPLRSGGKPLPFIEREAALRIAKERGYRKDETEEGLQLLEKRGLIILKMNRTRIYAEEKHIPRVEDLRRDFSVYYARLQEIKAIIPAHPQIGSLLEQAQKLQAFIGSFVKNPDEQKQAGLASTIRNRQQDLDHIVQEERNRLLATIRKDLQALKIYKGSADGYLDQPLAEGLFSQQLNAQRLSLIKDREEVHTKWKDLIERWSALFTHASQEQFAEKDLSMCMGEFKRLQSETNALRERLALLNTQFQVYDSTRQLLQRALDFQQRFSQVIPQIAEAFHKEFDAWVLQITGLLSSEKLKALELTPQWRGQFDDIYRRFEQQVQQEHDRFTSTQSVYKAAVQQHFKEGIQWKDIVFNPANPQDSYNRLWNRTYEIIQKTFSNKLTELQEVHDRVARLQGGALQVLTTEIRASRQQKVDAQQHYLVTMIHNTKVWIAELTGTLPAELQSNGTSKPTQELLDKIGEKIYKLEDWLSGVSDEIGDIEREIQASQLTEEQNVILEVLQSLCSKNDLADGVELGLLLQHLQSKAPQASWSSIIQLYSKQRLRIKIAPIGVD